MALNIAVLAIIGTYWGFSFTLTRIVMSGGAHPIVMTFWETAGAAMLVVGALWAAGRLPRLSRAYLRFSALIGLLGGAMPNALLFWAAANIGAGVLSVCMATVPLMQFALSALLGSERPRLLRLAGLVLGFAAVWLIVRPDAATAPFVWVAVAVGAAFCYTVEGAVIADRRPQEATPAHILAGMMVFASIFTSPILFIASEPWPFDAMSPGRIEWAFLIFIIGSPIAYGGFVWLITRAGAVFAAQVAYIVTLAGVFFGVWYLGETYQAGFWLALGMMIIALGLGLPGGRSVDARNAIR